MTFSIWHGQMTVIFDLCKDLPNPHGAAILPTLDHGDSPQRTKIPPCRGLLCASPHGMMRLGALCSKWHVRDQVKQLFEDIFRTCNRQMVVKWTLSIPTEMIMFFPTHMNSWCYFVNWHGADCYLAMISRCIAPSRDRGATGWIQPLIWPDEFLDNANPERPIA